MSKYNCTETDDDIPRSSNETTDNNYTKIYLDQDFSDDNCILELKSPESIRETVNGDTQVLHTFVDFNPLKRNSVKVLGTTIYTNKSYSPLSLNFDCKKPVKSYKNSNDILKPCIVYKFSKSLDNRNEKSLDHKNCDSYVQPSCLTERNELVIKYCEQNKYETFNLSTRDPRLKNYYKHKYKQRLINFKGLKRLGYNKKPYLNKNSEKINRTFENMNSIYNVGVSNNSDSFNNFIEQNIEGIKQFHVNEIEFDYTQNDVGAKGCINYNTVMKHINTEQNQKNRNVAPLIDFTNDDEEVVNLEKSSATVLQDTTIDETRSSEPFKNAIILLKNYFIDNGKRDVYNILSDTVEEEQNIECSKQVLNKNPEIQDANELYHDDPVYIRIYEELSKLENSGDSNDKKSSATVLQETTIDETRSNEPFKNAIILSKNYFIDNGKRDGLKQLRYNKNNNFLTLENSIFDNTQQTTGDNISGLIEINKNSKQIRSIEHSTTKSIEKHIDFTYGRNVTLDLNENLNFNIALITKKLENPKLISIVNESKDEDKFNQLSKNSKTINNEENSVISQHKKSKKSKYNKHKSKSPKHDKYSKLHKIKYSSKIDSKVLKMSDLVTIDTQSNDEQVSHKKIDEKLVKQIMKTNKNEVRNDPDKIIQLENKADNIDENHVENAFELIENKQCGIDSIEIVLNESCVEVKSNSNIFTESVSLATNLSKETHSLKPNTAQSLSNDELYNILSDAVEEEQNIECSKQVLNKNPEIQDANELYHDDPVYIRIYEELSKLENSGDSNDKKSSATVLQETTIDETSSNEPFKNATILSKDYFIDNGKPDETANTFQANNIGIRPYLNKLVVDTSNSSDTVVENKNINISTQNTDHISFSKWDDIKILSYVVNSKHDVRLKSGQQIINNYSKTDHRMPYHFVDTSYCKKYFRKLKCMLSNDVKSKWLGDKKTTLADQLSLYKCSGKNCKRVFSNQQLFRNHLNYHQHSSDKIKNENRVENAFELIENKQCGIDSIEIVFNESCVEVKSNSNIFTESVSLATNLSKETHSLKPNTAQSLSNDELYNILSDAVEEEQNIECSKQVLNKNPEIQDANELYHDDPVYIRIYEELSKLENSGDSNDKKSSATVLQETTIDETSSNEPFKNATILSKDYFIDNGKPDGNLESPHFMKCMYCFKQFENESISELGNHIMENYTFCEYFCRYCLYRAYTASHVLVHEYVFHNDQQPSIIQFKNRQGARREVVMAVDFNKFVLRYVCNIGCCTFSTYTNTDFLSHLILKHALRDEFYCDLCSNKNDNKYVCSNPESFVKHFSLHNINTYQCIFCLFGARNINVMLIHLAMEHFEYEPLCLERCPKSEFCDNRNIKNLKILNIQKYVTDKIIKVLASAKNGQLQECPTKEMNEKYKIDETGKSEEIDEVDKTPQVIRKIFKEIAQPSKNKSTVDNENNMIIISDEAKHDQRDAQLIQNVKASIVNDKKNKSQLSNYDIINNFELENNIEIQINKKDLETQSSEKPTDQTQNYENDKLDNESSTMDKFFANKAIDEVFPDLLSYEDHLNNCPLKSLKECTFCLAQSKATFEVVNLPKIVEPNRFTCTFCDTKLPSVTISRHHVRKEHHILNVEFVPLDINSNNIKKDRFLVCQYKSLNRKKLSNDCILLTESDESTTTTVSKKHSNVVNKHDDFQLTKSPNTLYNSKQNTRRSRDESEEQHKVLKRKHSTESCNVSLNVELHSVNKKKSVDKYIQSTQYNYLNVSEALASVAEPSTTITGFKELPPVKHTNVDEQVPSTKYNTLSVPEALANVSETSNTITGFKELPPVKHTNVDEQVPSTKYNTLSVPEALANVSETSNTITGFKKLPPVKHTNVDEQVPSTQYNMFNISNALASVAELSTKVAGFKDLQLTNKKKNVDQHIPSTQISMFNISEALDSVTELLATIARFKELPSVKQTDVDEHILSTQYNTLNVPEAVASVTKSSTTIAGFKDLQPTNKQKTVDQHIPSTQNSMFNFPEALDCVAELLSTIATGFKEIPIKSTTICSTSIKTIDVLVSEVQEKILSYPSRNPNGYLTLIRCIGKYACPVCNVFITEKQQSFKEHLLKEINGEIWECLKCFAISDSVEKMESHVIKHTLDKRNYEKIEVCNKNIWVNRIIELQNILIEYVRLKQNI